MSGVLVSKYARAPIQTAQWVRNGKPVVAEFQNALAELTGFVMSARPKFLFSRAAAIVTTGGSTLIPTSTSGERARWRFAWRSGPYASRLAVYLELAPQNSGSPNNPYVSFDVTNGNGAEIGYARRYYGSSDGSYTDVPRNFGGGISYLSADRRYAGSPAYLTPNTDYWGVFSDNDYARLVACAVWEISLTPDTDNGYPSTSVGVNGIIADKDRADISTASRSIWKKGGQQLINWCSDTDATAPVISAGSLSGALARTMSAVTLSAAGTTSASAPAFQAATTLKTAAVSTDLTVAWPTHASGDIAILLVGSSDAGVSLTTANGFEFFEGDGFYIASDERYMTIYAFWCRASGSSMSAPVIAGGTEAGIIASMVTFRGCVSSGSPFDVTTSTSRSFDDPAIGTVGATTSTDATLWVDAAVYGHGNGTTSNVSGWTNASLSSITERFDESQYLDPPFGGYGLAAASGVKTSAGAVSATDATFDDGDTISASVSFALKP
jgi:hypothetical protein